MRIASAGPKLAGVKLRAITRWLSPSGFVLIGMLMATPFITVSCDAPGGYGRAAPGSTTNYTAIDLATGNAPNVTGDHLRPPDQVQDDRIGPLPITIVLIILIILGAGAAIIINDRRQRRGTVAAIGGTALAALVLNQAIVQDAVEHRLKEQLTVAMPAGHTAKDYVKTGSGFVWCLLLLVVLTTANVIGWRRLRHPPIAEVARSGTDASVATPVDPWGPS